MQAKGKIAALAVSSMIFGEATQDGSTFQLAIIHPGPPILRGGEAVISRAHTSLEPSTQLRTRLPAGTKGSTTAREQQVERNRSGGGEQIIKSKHHR